MKMKPYVLVLWTETVLRNPINFLAHRNVKCYFRTELIYIRRNLIQKISCTIAHNTILYLRNPVFKKNRYFYEHYNPSYIIDRIQSMFLAILNLIVRLIKRPYKTY